MPGWRRQLDLLRNLPRFVRLVWRTSPSLALVSIGLRLLRAGVPIAVLCIAKLILDAVVAGGRGPAAAIWPPPGGFGRIGVLVSVEAGLGILASLLGQASVLADGLLMQRFGDRVSAMLMRHAAALDLEHFEAPEQQDRLDRARQQVTGRSNLLQLVFGQAQDVVTVSGLAVLLSAYVPWVLPLLGAAMVPAAVGEMYFNGAYHRISHKRAPVRRRIDYLRQLGSSPDTAKEVKLFGLEDFLVDRFAALSAAVSAQDRRLAFRRALVAGIFAALGVASYYAGYAILLARTYDGRLSIGDLTLLGGSLLRLRALVEGLLSALSQVAVQAAYLDDLFSFFDIRPRIVSPPAPAQFPRPLRCGIRFEGVGFRYPGSQRWVVRHLDLTLAAGAAVALIGENGAGKTTIVKLLTRLYDPTEGRITVDGVDLRALDLDDLRRNVAAVLQDFVRYDFTAGENVAVGDVASLADEARVVDAAERSLAAPVIGRLPRGYAQPLGRRFEGGVDLSGGEWQKFAIARAYMRDGAVVILDEPTAALDSRSEHEVFHRFRALSGGKTCLIISHRFSTVRMADQILVLGGGRVVQSGTHHDLMASPGPYAALFDLQAAGYR